MARRIAAPDRLPAGRANLGLVLRWQAALWEMQAFQAVPERSGCRIMTELGAAIRAALATARSLRERSPSRRPATGRRPSSRSRCCKQRRRRRADGCRGLRQVHRWLNADISGQLPAGVLCSARRLAALPCHLGQPVAIGRTAVLRICIGAQLVWETAFDESLGSSLEARLEAQIQRARLALRKTELIAQYYDRCAAGAVARSRPERTSS